MVDYPIYNRRARFVLSTTDRLLSLFFRPKHPLIDTPDSLLLCNTAHLGDVILTTALLRPLRAAYPDLKVGMLVREECAPLLQNHPELETIHVFGKPLPHYDVAIACNFHFPNAAPLLWRSKIPIRIGFTCAGLSPLLTHAFPWKERSASAAEAFFTLLAPLRVPHMPLKPALPDPPPSLFPPGIVLHMGTRDPRKKWPLEKWRLLAERLAAEGHTLYFTGRGKEQQQECAQASRGIGHNLCDALNWREFTALIKEARALITVDSAAGHIAAAFDTPSIILSTGIHPPNLWKPLSSCALPVVNPMPCSPCLTGCDSMQCVRQISVDKVYSLISPRPTRPAASSSAR